MLMILKNKVLEWVDPDNWNTTVFFDFIAYQCDHKYFLTGNQNLKL